MQDILKKATEKPFLYSKNNIVNEVNKDFINLTGYSNNELIGKTLAEISTMLRVDSQVCIESIEDKYSCFIFTKEYEPIEVTIHCENFNYKNEKTYFFKEKSDSNIKERFKYIEHVNSANEIGFAIYSLPDLTVLRMNNKYLEFIDAPHNKRGSVVGKNRVEIIPGFEGNNLQKVLLSNIKTGKPSFEKEIKCEHFERGTTYWDISLVPIFIDEKVKYVIETATEVTEKVVSRNLVEKQKEEFEAIIKSISDQVIFVDKNGKYTEINKPDINNHLYDSKPLKDNKTSYGKGEYFDINGDVILFENAPVQRVIRGEKVSGYIFAWKYNNVTTYSEVTGTPIYDEYGNFIKGVMVYNDVTERIRNQENLFLKAQYETLKTVIEHLDLRCTIASYPDFNIKYINNKEYGDLKKINLNPELLSIMGKSIFNIFKYNMYEKTQLEIKLQDLIEKKSNSCFYYRKQIENGKEKFFKIMCQPIVGLNNMVSEVIFITIDITKEVKAKNKMQKTLKIQDEMFSNISHELKTPLNVIFSTNQLMEFYSKKDSLEANKEKFSKGINIIKQNCYRFTKLINNIIDTSKIESGFLKLNLSNENIVNITEDIVQSISDYIKAKGLNIIFDTNTEEKIIACDTDKIERIILNLISNAIKFTNANGSIFVKLIDKHDTVEIYVKDTGIGMNQEHLNNIFKRFHQVDKSLSRNAEGSGIGLFLVKSIVELHGGKISVESKQGEGSIFKIELPSKIIEKSKVTRKNKSMNSKIEMINVEFSDIYKR
ncbi:histidine kinase [Clostridium beijerinckii]|nr:histidine kinase [Clostridium beijerinckii]